MPAPQIIIDKVHQFQQNIDGGYTGAPTRFLLCAPRPTTAIMAL
jgi:hypothetical protein